MMLQLSDVENIFFRTCRIQNKWHSFEMVIRLAEIRRLGRINILSPGNARRVTVRAFSLDRVIPVAHHLRHGTSYTARKNVSIRTIGIFGTTGCCRICFDAKWFLPKDRRFDCLGSLSDDHFGLPKPIPLQCRVWLQCRVP